MTRRILTAAILIPFVLASLLLFPLPLFLVILSTLLFIALREFSHLASSSGSKLYPLSYILALGAPWMAIYFPSVTGPFSLSAILITVVWCVISTKEMKSGFPDAAGNLLSLGYLSIPFALMATFHHASPQSKGNPEHPYELLLVLVIVWVSDAAALFVGRAIGRHRITQSISPNKTLEGYLAALIVPLLVAVAIGNYLVPTMPLWFLVAASLIISFSGILGDLFESILKRGAGIKDTSNLIPGHGGVLDRVDSLLFAVPAYCLLAHLSM